MQKSWIFGFGLAVMACNQPVDKDKDGFYDNEECDDSNPAISPKATDLVGDGYDQNCDGIDGTDGDGDGVASVLSGGIDCDDENPEVTGPSNFYRDLDEDGYGDPAQMVEMCEAPFGFVADNTDCLDMDAMAHPEAQEVCDGIDNDCDDLVDDDDDTVEGQFSLYRDLDGDGFGDLTQPVLTCDWTEDLVEDATDCDDTIATIHPNAEELLGDGFDNDCDSQELCYADLDGDGFGSMDFVYIPADSTGIFDCILTEGAADNSTDCNDEDVFVAPSVQEVCDGIDNDCDGLRDDEDDSTDLQTGLPFMMDLDRDGFGDVNNMVWACVQSPIMSTIPGDCNDVLASTNPLATDIVGDATDQNCDGVDGLDTDGDGYASVSSGGNDCDDTTNTIGAFTDSDADGYTCQEDCNDNDAGIYPSALDIPGDGIDQDCNGNDTAQQPLFADIANPTDEILDLICASFNTIHGDLTIDMTNLDSNSTEALSCLTGVYGRLEILNISSLSTISFEHLIVVGDLELSGGENYSFPVLQEAGSISISSNQSTNFDADPHFPQLQNMSGVFSWSYGSSVDISGFSQLNTLGGITIENDWMLTDVSAFGNIQHLESIRLFNTGLLDFSAGAFISVDSLTIRNNDDLLYTTGLQNLDSTIIVDIRNDNSLIEDGCMYLTESTNLLISQVNYNNFSAGSCDIDGDGVTLNNGDCDDQDGTLQTYDLDNDGFSTCDGDCDDTIFAIRPNATEIWYDGVDQNCDGLSDYDQDGDMDIALAYGGLDCDDSDISLNGLDLDGDGVTSCDGDSLEPIESCLEWHDLGYMQTGIYPLFFTNGSTRDVYCEMEMHGGGWTLFAVTDSFECVEDLRYGNNPLIGFTNPYFAMSLKNLSHTEFMQDMRIDGNTTDFSIVWNFLEGTDTLRNRFLDAYSVGIPVHWTVFFSQSEYIYSGNWRYSDSAFDSNPFQQNNGNSFSSDDGIWGAANGSVNGNTSTTPIWGQSVNNSNDGDCNQVYLNGTMYSSDAIQNRMYFR